MSPTRSLCLILALSFTLSCSLAEKCVKVCDFTDDDCVTRGAYNQYKSIVNGLGGKLPNMDPLYIDYIKGISDSTTENEATEFTLTNIRLDGLHNCDVISSRMNTTDESFKYRLSCPKLVSTFNIKFEQQQSNQIDMSITAYDYDILTIAHYGVFIKEEDDMPHFFVKPLISTTAVRNGKVYVTHHMDTTGTPSEEAHENAADKYNALIIQRSMRVLFEGIDKHARQFLMQEVLPGPEQEC